MIALITLQRSVATLLACIIGFSACHSRPPPVLSPSNQEKLAQHVVLVQSDGLSAELLQEYFLTAAAHRPDRVLRNYCGVAPSSDGSPSGVLFAVSPTVTVLPPLPDAASASLLTGLTPRGHGVRWPGDTLTKSAFTLHDRLHSLGYSSANVGFPFSKSADFNVDSQPNDQRTHIRQLIKWIERQSPRPSLVTIRFAGILESLRRHGHSAALTALEEQDQLLAELLCNNTILPSEQTALILTAGAPEALELEISDENQKNALGALLTDHVKFESIRRVGNVLWIPHDALKSAPVRMETAKLLSGSLFDHVALSEKGELKIYDEDLDALRPSSVIDQIAPSVERGLLEMMDPGDIVAIRRVPSSPIEQSHKLDYETPLLIYSRHGDRLLGTDRKRYDLTQVAPTVATLLGLELFPQSAAALALPVIQPGTRSAHADPATAEILPCREAVDRLTDVEATCGTLLHQTTSRESAAEAIVALTVSSYVRRSISFEDAKRAIHIAYWLSDVRRWPRDDAGLLASLAGSAAKTDWHYADILIAIGSMSTPGQTELQDAIRLTRGQWVLSGESEPTMQFLSLSVPDGPGAAQGHQLAATMARFSHAKVVLWGDAEPAAAIRVTAPTPVLASWLGPAWLGTGVADTAFPMRASLRSSPTGSALRNCAPKSAQPKAEGPATRGQPTLDALCSYFHLAQGLDAVAHGAHEYATEHLWAANYLDSPADHWRATFYLWTSGQGHDFHILERAWPEPLAYDRDAEPWSSKLANIFILTDFLADGSIGEAKYDYRSLFPTDDHPWSPQQRTLLEAFSNLSPTSELRLNFCSGASQTARVERVARAAALFESLSMPGLAAYAYLEQLRLLTEDDQLRAALLKTLNLLLKPASQWARIDLSKRLLSFINSRKSAFQALPKVVDQIENTLLVEIWNAIKQDKLPGFESRNTWRAAMLVSFFAGRRQDLAIEILAGLIKDRKSGVSPIGLFEFASNTFANQPKSVVGRNLDWLNQVLNLGIEGSSEEVKPGSKEEINNIFVLILSISADIMNERTLPATLKSVFLVQSFQPEQLVQKLALAVARGDIDISALQALYGLGLEAYLLPMLLNGNSSTDSLGMARRLALTILHSLRDGYIQSYGQYGMTLSLKKQIEFTSELLEQIIVIAMDQFETDSKQAPPEASSTTAKAGEKNKTTKSESKIVSQAILKKIINYLRSVDLSMGIVQGTDMDSSQAQLISEQPSEMAKTAARGTLAVQALLFDAIWLIDVAENTEGVNRSQFLAAQARLRVNMLITQDYIQSMSIPFHRAVAHAVLLAERLIERAPQLRHMLQSVPKISSKDDAIGLFIKHFRMTSPQEWAAITTALRDAKETIRSFATSTDLRREIQRGGIDGLLLEHCIWIMTELYPERIGNTDTKYRTDILRSWLEPLYAHSKGLLTDKANGIEHYQGNINRVFLAIELAGIDVALKRPNDALGWLKRGRQWSAGTIVSQYDYLWSLSEYWAARIGGNPDLRSTALNAAMESCPRQADFLAIDDLFPMVNQPPDAIDKLLQRHLASVVSNQNERHEALAGGDVQELWSVELTTAVLPITVLIETVFRDSKFGPLLSMFWRHYDKATIDEVVDTEHSRLWLALAQRDEARVEQLVEEIIGLHRGMDPRRLLGKTPAGDESADRRPRPTKSTERLQESAVLIMLVALHGHRVMADEWMRLAAKPEEWHVATTALQGLLKKNAESKKNDEKTPAKAAKSAKAAIEDKRLYLNFTFGPIDLAGQAQEIIFAIRKSALLSTRLVPSTEELIPPWSLLVAQAAAEKKLNLLRQWSILGVGAATAALGLFEGFTPNMLSLAAQSGYPCEVARLVIYGQKRELVPHLQGLLDKCQSASNATQISILAASIHGDPGSKESFDNALKLLAFINMYDQSSQKEILRSVRNAILTVVLSDNSNALTAISSRASRLIPLLAKSHDLELRFLLRVIGLAADTAGGVVPKEAPMQVLESAAELGTLEGGPREALRFLKNLAYGPSELKARQRRAQAYLNSSRQNSAQSN